MNIIFVCTGNTCRSPVAEGFMKKTFKENNRSGDICSRGLAVIRGSEVSSDSVFAAGEYGVDISSHIPQMLTADDISDADYVFCMSSNHKLHINFLYPEFSGKVFAISELTGLGDISDPYGGGAEVYMNCAKQIYEAVQIIFEKIVDNNANCL